MINKMNSKSASIEPTTFKIDVIEIVSIPGNTCGKLSL